MKRWGWLIIGLAVWVWPAWADWADFFSGRGVTFHWDSFRQIGLLSRADGSLAFRPGFDQAVWNADTIIDLPGIKLVDGNLDVSAAAWAQLESLFPLPNQSASSWRIGTIIIDPGHGGSDPGSSATFDDNGHPFTLVEKDLTLAVALELEKRLKVGWPDRQIVLTRRTDTYPTLEQRVDLANARQTGGRETVIYLSLHFNASLNAKASGLEFWYIPQDYSRDLSPEAFFPNTQTEILPVINLLLEEEVKKESRRLAEQLSQSLTTGLGTKPADNRGLKENAWFVVRMAKMPAVLAELGFLTNREEGLKLKDPQYLKKLADGLYNGLRAYVAAYEETK